MLADGVLEYRLRVVAVEFGPSRQEGGELLIRKSFS